MQAKDTLQTGQIPCLPQQYKDRMRELLGAEYEAFLASYEKTYSLGLRRNPLKASAEEFTDRLPFALTRVEWCAEGYYCRLEDSAGKNLFHEIGAYYMQEPSAMAAAELLAPQPGEKILDLCAAPGGKSTHIAGKMEGRGLLVSNEVVQGRANTLSRNIERMGVKNCVVCNEKPERMAEFFPNFFDRVLVDAPCSGEGMFRKNAAAIEEWSPENVEMCAKRQLLILEEAAKALRAGGVLVYATCTFEAAENEEVIGAFLKAHQEFRLDAKKRLMPHKVRGEGHFVARLIKCGGQSEDGAPVEKRSGGGKRLAERVSAFLTEEIGLDGGWLERQDGSLERFGENLYLIPQGMPSLKGLRIVRAGLHIGTDKKNRIEPSHALALSIRPQETTRKREIDRQEAERYLRGEGLVCGTEKGWLLLCCEGYSVGFGKASNGQIKNHYPRGLRIVW